MLWSFVSGKGNPLAFSNVVLLSCGVVPGPQHSKNGINLLSCWRKTVREKKPGNVLKTCTTFEKHICTKKLVDSAVSMHMMSLKELRSENLDTDWVSRRATTNGSTDTTEGATSNRQRLRYFRDSATPQRYSSRFIIKKTLRRKWVFPQVERSQNSNTF